MKKILLIGILLATSLLVKAESPPSMMMIQDTTYHPVNSHACDTYNPQRTGTKMMIFGAAFLAVGTVLDYNFERNGTYNSDNYPYSVWAATGAKALQASGLIIFIGGLNNFLKIKF